MKIPPKVLLLLICKLCCYLKYQRVGRLLLKISVISLIHTPCPACILSINLAQRAHTTLKAISATINLGSGASIAVKELDHFNEICRIYYPYPIFPALI